MALEATLEPLVMPHRHFVGHLPLDRTVKLHARVHPPGRLAKLIRTELAKTPGLWRIMRIFSRTLFAVAELVFM